MFVKVLNDYYNPMHIEQIEIAPLGKFWKLTIHFASGREVVRENLSAEAVEDYKRPFASAGLVF